MPNYDAARYDPPAPLAEVTLRRIDTRATLPNVLLLIDTGADITLLPRWAAEHLGIGPLVGSDYELMAFDGTKTIAPTVELDMVFLRKAYRGRYPLIDDERGILGRDVLGNVALLLDGPRQVWSEHVG